MKVFDENSESKILINPKISLDTQKIIKSHLEKQPILNHYWLSTSGTTSKNSMKWVALSKKSIQLSAEAVNQHLYVTQKDRWINALPDFHVGGLGIWARAELSNSEVIDYKAFHEKWDPLKFHSLCLENKANFTSLVPAQVFDLIHLELKAPHELKAIIVGGGSLNEALYQKGKILGWNLLPSYGMTECASQIATATLTSLMETSYPQLKILSHIDALEKDSNNYCKIKSKSLLTCYAYLNENYCEIVDPKTNDFFLSEDIVEISDKFVKPLGRSLDMIKIGGENVNLMELNHILHNIKYSLNLSEEVVLIPYPNHRLGTVIHLVTSGIMSSKIRELIDEFNLKTLPFENIREVHYLEKFPYTDLKKVNIKKILELI